MHVEIPGVGTRRIMEISNRTGEIRFSEAIPEELRPEAEVALRAHGVLRLIRPACTKPCFTWSSDREVVVRQM